MSTTLDPVKQRRKKEEEFIEELLGIVEESEEFPELSNMVEQEN